MAASANCRSVRSPQTHFGCFLPLRFWEQAVMIVFMVAGSSAPEPSSAG